MVVRYPMECLPWIEGVDVCAELERVDARSFAAFQAYLAKVLLTAHDEGAELRPIYTASAQIQAFHHWEGQTDFLFALYTEAPDYTLAATVLYAGRRNAGTDLVALAEARMRLLLKLKGWPDE
jgi:hypothetical protein